MKYLGETYLGTCLKNSEGETCQSRSVYANGYCGRHGGDTPMDPSLYVGRAKDVWEKRQRKRRNKDARIERMLRIRLAG